MRAAISFANGYDAATTLRKMADAVERESAAQETFILEPGWGEKSFTLEVVSEANDEFADPSVLLLADD